MARRNISSGAPWESVVGYSRAVRIGDLVAVSGSTAAEPDGTVCCPDDAAGQTRRALAVVESALKEAGAGLGDVIRTRIYVTDIGLWEGIGTVHGEVFADIRPATTMVEVAKLIHPEMLVEIEADAYLSAGS